MFQQSTDDGTTAESTNTVFLPDGTRITKIVRTSCLPDGTFVIKTKTETKRPPLDSSSSECEPQEAKSGCRHIVKTEIRRIRPDGSSSTSTSRECFDSPSDLQTGSLLEMDDDQAIHNHIPGANTSSNQREIGDDHNDETNVDMHENLDNRKQHTDETKSQGVESISSYCWSFDDGFDEERGEPKNVNLETIPSDEGPPLPSEWDAFQRKVEGESESISDITRMSFSDKSIVLCDSSASKEKWKSALRKFEIDTNKLKPVDESEFSSRWSKSSGSNMQGNFEEKSTSNHGDGGSDKIKTTRSYDSVLAFARKIEAGEGENKDIYPAFKYYPRTRLPFYQACSVRILSIITLMLIAVCASLVVVLSIKLSRGEPVVVISESDTPTVPPTSLRDISGVRELIEANVLRRNATFQELKYDDPRVLAMNWLLYGDPLQLDVFDDNLAQRYSLAVLAFSFDSMAWIHCGNYDDLVDSNANLCSGKDFHEANDEEKYTWLSGVDECEWYGVTCLEGVVLGLEIDQNNLVGEIPPEISGLENLKILSLHQNCIYGTIPPELGALSHLEQLDLYKNGLSGVIPNDLFEISSLMQINVAYQYWNIHNCTRSDGTMAEMQYARGDSRNDYNDGLKGEIFGDSIAKLPNLMQIRVDDNSFDGEIAPAIGNLRQLVILSGGNNLFSGTLPNELTQLTNLEELVLGQSYISGPIPEKIGDMESLEVLFFWDNGEMNGTIPDSLYNLTKLKTLNLGKNQFNGTISTSIGNLEHLETLILGRNRFTGILPSELGLCHELSILRIENTDIDGTVPPELQKERNHGMIKVMNYLMPTTWNMIFTRDYVEKFTGMSPSLRHRNGTDSNEGVESNVVFENEHFNARIHEQFRLREPRLRGTEVDQIPHGPSTGSSNVTKLAEHLRTSEDLEPSQLKININQQKNSLDLLGQNEDGAEKHLIPVNQTFIEHLKSLQPFPKKVHIFFPDKNYWNAKPVLPFVQHSILALKSLNPDWNITVYDDNDVDNIICKAAKENIISQEECNILVGGEDEAAHIVERSDIARLILMYMEGGLYVDADRLISKKLSSVIYPNTKLCLPTHNDVNFAQDLMGTSPGNKLFFSMIRKASDRRMKGGRDKGPLQRRQGWIDGGSLFDMGPPLYNIEILKMVFIGLTENDYHDQRSDSENLFGMLRESLMGLSDALIVTGKETNCNHGLLVDESLRSCPDRSELYAKYQMTPWAEEVNERWKDV
ncbi:hypothetical protein ACHAXS_014161 [Conticribra weissflogii]